MATAFELVPQKLVYGGEALGYHQGKVVMVPRVLPGERVEVAPVRTSKGVLHARPLRVVVGAPDRVEPPCRYFGRCGGCQYQHMTYASQLRWKLDILRETLRRLGKTRWDNEIPLHAAHPWNYRNQARMKLLSDTSGKLAMGFREAGSHRICPVQSCALLSPRLNAILVELRASLRGAELAGCDGIELLANERDEEVMLTLRADVSANGESLARDLLRRLAGLVGIALEARGGLRTFGQPTLTYRVGEFGYRVSPGSFFQASRHLLPDLAASVTALDSPVAALSCRRTLALDLYAGIGLFTLPLARQFNEVFGVEANPRAAVDLKENARLHGLSEVRAVAESVFEFLRRFARAEPDLVVLNPPRAGVGARTLKLLVELRPQYIRYLSCSPPTLARDLCFLTAHGYRLNSVELFDLFPQTAHIECLTKFIRNDLLGS